jgi:hypothetical protein
MNLGLDPTTLGLFQVYFPIFVIYLGIVSLNFIKWTIGSQHTQRSQKGRCEKPTIKIKGLFVVQFQTMVTTTSNSFLTHMNVKKFKLKIYLTQL